MEVAAEIWVAVPMLMLPWVPVRASLATLKLPSPLSLYIDKADKSPPLTVVVPLLLTVKFMPDKVSPSLWLKLKLNKPIGALEALTVIGSGTKLAGATEKLTAARAGPVKPKVSAKTAKNTNIFLILCCLMILLINTNLINR